MLQTELSSKQTPARPSQLCPHQETQFPGQAVLSSAEIKPMFLYAKQALSKPLSYTLSSPANLSESGD